MSTPAELAVWSKVTHLPVVKVDYNVVKVCDCCGEYSVLDVTVHTAEGHNETSRVELFLPLHSYLLMLERGEEDDVYEDFQEAWYGN